MAILMVVSVPVEGLPEKQQPVVPSQEWSGSVIDISLRKDAPEVILSTKEFEALWLAWKLPGPVPEVDFSSNLVVVQTTEGSRLRLAVSQDDKGNVKALGLATRDFRPGFRYVIAVLSRKGVKTVNGKELVNIAVPPHSGVGSTQDYDDFGIPAGIEVRSVKSLDTSRFNEEISQGYRKGEAWTEEMILVALKLVGEGLKGNTKSIEVSTPPEVQDTATITITESGYLDDAVAGERWRLWMTKKADGAWVVSRAIWAQLCSRPGKRFYSAERCP